MWICTSDERINLGEKKKWKTDDEMKWNEKRMRDKTHQINTHSNTDEKESTKRADNVNYKKKHDICNSRMNT